LVFLSADHRLGSFNVLYTFGRLTRLGRE
jgi:hypothetical protein